MSDTTPEQDPAADLGGEAQAPTPTPSSGDAGEITAVSPDDESDSENRTEGRAETPEQAESPEDADPDEVPSTEELEEPSTEKSPGEEPKAPKRDDPEPDHQAVGIGVIDGPQTDQGD